MVGAINYLRDLKNYCSTQKGDCRCCPLGRQTKIEDTLCPRLTPPKNWTNEKTADMVSALERRKNEV